MVFEHVVGRLVEANNRLIRRFDRATENPRSLTDCAWHTALAGRYPAIRGEWDRFVAAGGRLPLIDDVIDEDQGTDGPWHAGLLVSRGRPVGPIARRFPDTVEALAVVPGLRSALWSVLPPGSELPEHRGPNAGVLRYHLGVRCAAGAALAVGGVEVPYRDADGILFDDTATHAAWNRGPLERVTLFCEMLRPLPAPVSSANSMLQGVLSMDRRYRGAPARAAAWDDALNRRLPT